MAFFLCADPGVLETSFPPPPPPTRKRNLLGAPLNSALNSESKTAVAWDLIGRSTSTQTQVSKLRGLDRSLGRQWFKARAWGV